MSYKAIVTKIKIFPHPNADNIQLGKAGNYQVVVGKNTVDDELGIYFGSDGQLSEAFAIANDLVSRVDANGQRAGGYFGKSRRVKAQNFRGEKSEGYWCPLSCFAFTGYDLSTLKEGDQIDALNEIPICNKYFTPATIRAMGNKQGKLRKKNPFFLEHVETKQLKHDVGNIPVGARISITEKVHGTSQRSANVPDEIEIKLNIIQRICRFLAGEGFGAIRKESKFDEFIGTRRTVLKSPDQPGYYGNEEFRINAARPFEGKLHKNEEVFYEVVGYTTTGKEIMSPQATEGLKDKRLSKQYGSHMVYKYGCLQGTCDIYVYRIAIVNGDGIAFDLPLEQVKRRCEELGVKYVPQLFPDYVYDGNKEDLLDWVSKFTEGPSAIDNSHIKEGLVIRTEHANGVTFYKAKSHTFGILEGYAKEDENFVDTEEIN
jgi:RNA ligase (TIGR02306 family)